MRCALLCLPLLALPLQAAGLYKWIDERGQVQYSDKPPQPQNIQRGSMEKLDRHGLLIRKIDPILTDEQRRAYDEGDEPPMSWDSMWFERRREDEGDRGDW